MSQDFLLDLKDFITAAKYKGHVRIDNREKSIVFLKSLDELAKEGFFNLFFTHNKVTSFSRSMNNYQFSKHKNSEGHLTFTYTGNLEQSLEKAIEQRALVRKRAKSSSSASGITANKKIRILQTQLNEAKDEAIYWKCQYYNLHFAQLSQQSHAQRIMHIPQAQHSVFTTWQPEPYSAQQVIQPPVTPQPYYLVPTSRSQEDHIDPPSSQDRKRQRVDDSSDRDKRPNTYSFSIDKFVESNSDLPLQKGFSRVRHHSYTRNPNALFSSISSTNPQGIDDKKHSDFNLQRTK